MKPGPRSNHMNQQRAEKFLLDITRNKCSEITATLLLSLLQHLLTLFHDAELDALCPRQSHIGLATIADDENVLQTSGEGVAGLVLHVHNIKGTRVFLNVVKETNATDVLPLGDHDQVSNFKLDNTSDFTSGQVKLDGVVDTDQRIWEA